jgi:hypothetical protein
MPEPPLLPDVHVEDIAYDSTQEMRAMILAALPYPPLPVLLRRLEDGNALGGEVLQTSHDIISTLLADACAKATVSDNEARRECQMETLRGLLSALGQDGLQAPPDLYSTYCDFTARHIASYLGGGADALPEIRFLPLEHVCKGDAAHRRTCDYMAAQARLLDLGEGYAAQDWMRCEYAQMLTIARNRLLCEAPGPGEREEE